MSSSLLSILLMLLVGALLAQLTSQRLNRWAVPAIVLELLVGFVLGNTLLPFSRIQPLVGLTELGVLSLFFQVGLEVGDGLVGTRPAAVLRTVLLSALTPVLAWWPLRQLLGLSPGSSLLCLAVLSATGTGVTLRTLAQSGALATPSGRLLVSVSVLDDLPAIGLLSLALLLGNPPGVAGAGGVTSALMAGSGAAGGLPPGTSQGLVILVILASVVGCRFWRRRHGPWQPAPLEVLLLLVGSSWLAEISGLTSLLGAIWGGVLLNVLAVDKEANGSDSQPWQKHLILLSEVFLPLYFISVGLRIEITTLLEPRSWGLALLLTMLGIGCKLLCAAGIRRDDLSAGVDRWVVVYGLIPRGLPGLVFANAALDAGLIDPPLFASLVLMVCVTTVVGLLLLGQRLRRSQRLSRVDV